MAWLVSAISRICRVWRAASLLPALTVAALVVGGCGGTSLSACPDHQPCVHFVSNPSVGGNGAVDGSVADPGDDMARSSASDLATSPADQSQPAGDLASSPAADLAPACLPTGGSCPNHNDAICCSHYCVYATNSCR